MIYFIIEYDYSAHTAHISTHLVELKSTHRVDFTSKSTYSVDLKMHKSTSTVDLGINIFEPSCHISIVFSCEWLPNPLSNHQNDGEIGCHIYRNWYISMALSVWSCPTMSNIKKTLCKNFLTKLCFNTKHIVRFPYFYFTQRRFCWSIELDRHFQ